MEKKLAVSFLKIVPGGVFWSLGLTGKLFFGRGNKRGGHPAINDHEPKFHERVEVG